MMACSYVDFGKLNGGLGGITWSPYDGLQISLWKAVVVSVNCLRIVLGCTNCVKGFSMDCGCVLNILRCWPWCVFWRFVDMYFLSFWCLYDRCLVVTYTASHYVLFDICLMVSFTISHNIVVEKIACTRVVKRLA